MTTDREACATIALREHGELWGLAVEDLLAQENGHRFSRGWHIGWSWVPDSDRVALDLLDEHRMAGIEARRVWCDGRVERIAVPSDFRRVGDTPEENARLQAAYFERNQRAYDDLRRRGLLPDHGANLGLQDLNEFLKRGG